MIIATSQKNDNGDYKFSTSKKRLLSWLELFAVAFDHIVENRYSHPADEERGNLPEHATHPGGGFVDGHGGGRGEW